MFHSVLFAMNDYKAMMPVRNVVDVDIGFVFPVFFPAFEVFIFPAFLDWHDLTSLPIRRVQRGI